MANLVIRSEQKAAIATKIAKVNEEVLPHLNQNYQYILNFIEIVMCVIVLLLKFYIILLSKECPKEKPVSTATVIYFTSMDVPDHRFSNWNCEIPSSLLFSRSSEKLLNISLHSYWIYDSLYLFKNGSCVVENYNCGEFGLLGNFLISDGMPGKVLCIPILVKSSKHLITL